MRFRWVAPLLPLLLLVFCASSLGAGPGSGDAPPLEADTSLGRLLANLSDRRSDVRESAAKALGKMGDPRAVDPLVDALGDPLDGVRDAAAAALKGLGEPLGEAIRACLPGSGMGREEQAEKAREELAKRKDPRALAPLARALGAWNVDVRVAAARTLAVLGDPDAVVPLAKAMSGQYKPVREAAALALSKIGDPRAFDPLVLALGDSHDPVRAAAASGLGQFKDRRAVDPLVRALSDWFYSVREGAARSLGTIGDARAVEPLIRSLEDKHANVREAAARSLAEFQDRRAVAPLIRALGDEEGKVRETVVLTLGKLGDRRAVDPVVSALGDGEPGVRKAATRVLDGFGEPLGRQIYAALEGAGEARAELAEKKDPRSVDPLIACLRNPRGKVRRAAARILGDIGDRRAVDGLVALAGGWSVPDRLAAVSALFRIDQAVYPDLLDALLRVASQPASMVYSLVPVLAAVLVVYRRRRSARTRSGIR